MVITHDLLFVYGTLLENGNEFAAYLHTHCTYRSEGKFKGDLYDTGEYPAAILDAGSNYVYGRIYTLTNPDTVLKMLDNYEGFGDDQQQPNLFIRTLINVETTGGLIRCWVYLYNLPIDGLSLIKSGDYLKYKMS